MSFFDRIAGLLKQTGASPSFRGADDLKVATAALLVEAARMDESFDESERRAIANLLIERFALSPGEARSLLDAAEDAAGRSTQLFRFTQTVAGRLSLAERERIVEMLWDVAYADGVLAAQEDALIRRIAALIYVDDAGRMAARRRVRRRLGLGN